MDSMSGERRHWPEFVMEFDRDMSKEPNTEERQKENGHTDRYIQKR